MSTKSKSNNNNNSRGTRSKRSGDAPEKPDNLLTLAEWKKLPLETLKLKCNNRVNPTGKKEVLAQRLYDHFHPNPANNNSTKGKPMRPSTMTLMRSYANRHQK